jgi:hypothetical protein
MSIAAAKEMELSKAFLDLLRQSAEKDPEWQATRDAVLRKDENVAEELKLRTTSYTTGDTHDPALKLRIRSQNHDSKGARYFGDKHRGFLREVLQGCGLPGVPGAGVSGF